jgi:small subunit ribosomal protein S8
MSIDSIGNFLTIIRNGVMASKRLVEAPYSRMALEIATLLQKEGFIRSFSVIDEDAVKKRISMVLKYVDGESVIHEITRRSRPGRRYYVASTRIKPIIGGLGVSILTTSQGVMTHKKAKEFGVGGEVICTVW